MGKKRLTIKRKKIRNIGLTLWIKLFKLFFNTIARRMELSLLIDFECLNVWRLTEPNIYGFCFLTSAN